MFTGLVADLGRIEEVERSADGVRLIVSSSLAAELDEGDSIAVNGVCLTATDVQPTGVRHRRDERDAAPELAGRGPRPAPRSTSSWRCGCRTGSAATWSRATSTASARSAAIAADGFSRRVEIEAGDEILRYVVHKGSITVDGVSLTVAGLEDASFTVSLIPETLERTNLGHAEVGTTVNLEVDVLAKYVERLVASAR